MSDRKASPLREAIIVAICGNLLAALCSLFVFRDPPGSAIRPMDITAYQLIIAVGTAAKGLPLVKTSWTKDGNRFGALVAFVFCMSPFLAGVFSLTILTEWFGYELKP